MLDYTDCCDHIDILVSAGGYSCDGSEISLHETLLNVDTDQKIKNELVPEHTIFEVTFDNWFIEEPIKLFSDISRRIMKFRLSAEELAEASQSYEENPTFFVWPDDSFEVIEWDNFPITDNSIPKEIIELFTHELVERCGDTLSEYETELENGALENFPESVVNAVKIEIDRYNADVIETPPKGIKRSTPLSHGEI